MCWGFHGFPLAPLPAAEVLVRQGPFNGELCWQWFFSQPAIEKARSAHSLSKWIKELIRKVWLRRSDQNLLRLLNGIMLCQRGKRGFSHWFLAGGHRSVLWKIFKTYTQWIYSKVLSRVRWGTLPIPLQGRRAEKASRVLLISKLAVCGSSHYPYLSCTSSRKNLSNCV